MLCDKREISVTYKSFISHNPQQEYSYILKDIWMMQNIVKKIKFQLMQDDFYPPEMRPHIVEGFPATYVESCLLIELLDIFSKYIEDNKSNLMDGKKDMTHILQTNITIEDGTAMVNTDVKELRELLKTQVKEYKEYGIKYFTLKEDKNETNSKY
jgi:hypothetical protein